MTYYNFQIKLILCLFSVVFFSCEASAEIEQPDTTYQQWGTPFQGVPDREDVVMYQVNIRSFSQEGNFSGVERRLDSIQNLGANVIYLMPIYPVGQERSAGGMGSPYAIRDYKAVNEEFGALDDLRNLVDRAHERGMAVILDWVANHTAWDHPWLSTNRSWYQQDASGNVVIPPGTNWQDVAQLNYQNRQMRLAMIDAMEYWVYNANIDGFRFDAADYVPHDFWVQAIQALRSIDDHKLLLMAEGDRNDHFNAGFDYTFGFGFFYTLKDQIFENGNSVKLLENDQDREYQGAAESQRVVRYVSNHDVNIYEGTPRELFGQRGSIAAFVVAAYMKSIPMIYNGQEVGYDTRLEFFSRTPIDWSQSDYSIQEEYKAIIDFYHSSDAIRKGDFMGYSNDDVATFVRAYEGEKILVLSNLRDRNVDSMVPADVRGAVEDVFHGTEVNLESQIRLGPFEYRVFRLEQ
ncbi:MAG TPA: alpha-amylase family glycosyl hydrolase [Anditalea sp.]|nr:alpha-amylase family glycosyl hydrolase [Anditalea sp.]